MRISALLLVLSVLISLQTQNALAMGKICKNSVEQAGEPEKSKFEIAFSPIKKVRLKSEGDPKDLPAFMAGKPEVDGGIETKVPILNQECVGFCWAYGGSNLITSETMKNTGKLVEVSRDNMGFWNFYFQIFQNEAYFKKMAEKVKRGEVNATDVARDTVALMKSRPSSRAAKKAANDAGWAPDEGSDVPTAFKQLLVTGVVPDELFDHPIPTISKEKQLTQALQNLVQAILTSSDRASMFGSTDPDQINTPLYTIASEQLKEFYKGKAGNDHLPYRPNDTFTYNGAQYTPLQFMNQVMQFNPNEWVTVTGTKGNMESIYQAIQYSLFTLGTPVPIGFAVYNQQQGEQDGGWSASLFSNGQAEYDGGHEVLIVNVRMSSDGKMILGLIFQNSWGQQGLDRNGNKPATKSASGYNFDTPEYLEITIDQGEEPPDFTFHRNILTKYPVLNSSIEVNGSADYKNPKK